MAMSFCWTRECSSPSTMATNHLLFSNLCLTASSAMWVLPPVGLCHERLQCRKQAIAYWLRQHNSRLGRIVRDNGRIQRRTVHYHIGKDARYALAIGMSNVLEISKIALSTCRSGDFVQISLLHGCSITNPRPRRICTKRNRAANCRADSSFLSQCASSSFSKKPWPPETMARMKDL